MNKPDFLDIKGKSLKEIIVMWYKHHFIRYLFTGGTTFIIYFGIIYTLHGVEDVHLAIATSIAYWVSIIYNFCLNRWWTFDAAENQSLHKHAIPYLVLLGFNYFFNVIFVTSVSKVTGYGIATVLAVGIQMTWTYYIYKNVIFVKKAHKSTSADKTATTSKA